MLRHLLAWTIGGVVTLVLTAIIGAAFPDFTFGPLRISIWIVLSLILTWLLGLGAIPIGEQLQPVEGDGASEREGDDQDDGTVADDAG